MFLEVNPTRFPAGITQNVVGDLKRTEFYSKSIQDKLDCWNNLSKHTVISCHRQLGFDFNNIEPVTVISIKINDRRWLYNRVIEKHWNYLNYDLGSENLRKIKEQLPPEQWPALIESAYQQWERANILDTDIVLDFECILDDRIINWCKDQNLAVSQEVLDIIRQDIKNYQ